MATNKEKRAFKKKKEKERSDRKKLLKRRKAARIDRKAQDEIDHMQREIEKIQNKASQIRKIDQWKTSENGTQT